MNDEDLTRLKAGAFDQMTIIDEAQHRLAHITQQITAYEQYKREQQPQPFTANYPGAAPAFPPIQPLQLIQGGKEPTPPAPPEGPQAA